MSLARRHRTRMLAAAHAAANPATPAARTAGGREATEYELMRAALGVDLRRLKEIQSIERKIELKRDLLPAYDDWVAGVLAADSGSPDDILVQTMIWQIDVGAFDRALPLADYVLRHGLDLPERFDRTPATLIAEEIAEAALKELGQDRDFDRDVLLNVDDLTEDHDMPDQVRAKIKKALGLALVRSADATDPNADGPAGAKRALLEQGLASLRRALALDSNAGVKKAIERLDREIAKLKAAQAATED